MLYTVDRESNFTIWKIVEKRKFLLGNLGSVKCRRSVTQFTMERNLLHELRKDSN